MTRAPIQRSAVVALLAERRYLAQRQPAGLAAELRRRGCEVTLVDADAEALRLTDGSWLAGVDVCVARGRSDAVLGLLTAAERRGVPVLNRPAAVASVVDKVGMAAALAAAGIQTPPTLLGTAAQLESDLPADLYPVVVKPVRGDNCRGLEVCGTPDEVARVPSPRDEQLLAQPYLASDGTDLKLYGAGERVWAVRKPSPLRPSGSPWYGGAAAAVRVDLTSSLRLLALDCAAQFGLELYGVDCVVTPAGPVVIEINDFPNYTGVEDADAALASHVLARQPGGSPAEAPVTEVAQ